jgi:hypothetical protein
LLPLFTQSEQAVIVTTIKTSKPIDHELPGRGWTLKKLRHWVASKLGRQVSCNTLRTILQSAGFSWKKCKKLLAKADPKKRAAFVTQFQRLYEQICQEDIFLIYLDEVHLHQDMEVGYTWSAVGEADWIPNTSPGLAHRINWFGAYNFTDGDCFIWENGPCNAETTMQFLQQLQRRFTGDTRKIVLICA